MDDVELMASSCVCWLNLPVLSGYHCCCRTASVTHRHTHKGRCLCLALAAAYLCEKDTASVCDKTTTPHTSTLLLIKTTSKLLLIKRTCKPGWGLDFLAVFCIKKKKKRHMGSSVFLKEPSLSDCWYPTWNLRKVVVEQERLAIWVINYWEIFSLTHLEARVFLVFSIWRLRSSQTQIDLCVLLNLSTRCLDTVQVHFQETDSSILIKLWLSELSSCSKSVS